MHRDLEGTIGNPRERQMEMEQEKNEIENGNENIEDEVEELVERKRWGFLGLPFTFTVYHVKKDVLTIDSGCFKKVEDDCYMYKIQDVKLERGMTQRWFGLGNVIMYTGDTTHPELVLKNIKHSKETKEFILKYSEEARLKRRTLNTLDIGAGHLSDLDELS